MDSLAPLVGRRLNLPLAWLATATLAAAAVGFLLAGPLHWAVLAALLVAVALVPAAVERDPQTTFPGELLVLVALPVVVRFVGLFDGTTPFLAVAGLALLVAVLLDVYTSLDLSPRFAVVFVVVTTLAFIGVWTVGVWLSDRLFGTAFVAGQQGLMWDITGATAMGGVGGLVVQQYLVRTDHDDAATEQVADSGTETAADDRDGGGDDPEMTGDGGASRLARLAVRAMQVALVGIVALGAWRGNWGLLVNSAIPLAVTFLPAAFRREYGYSMHAGVVFWLTLAVFLHAVGTLGPYRAFGWYDSVTHAVSGSLVAGVGYAVARAVELHTGHVSFDPRFRALFLVLFVLATGVGWELLEFSTGLVAGATGGDAALAQYGVDDIALDLVYTAVGGLAVAAWGTGYFERPGRALVGRVEALVDRE